MKASILLPTYNEAENIVPLIEAIFGFKPPAWEFEVIVIDDNSPDGTHRVATEAFAKDPRVKTLLRTKDRGLSLSLREGLRHATGDRIIFMGSDFTHDPKELPKLLHVSDIYDIAMGSRFCAGGNMEYLPHYLCSLAYNWWIRILLRTQIQDNLGGYIAIRRECLDKMPLDFIFRGYGEFCFRLLHYAQRAGMTIVEIPVYFRTRQKGNSKSHFFALLFQYTAAALRLRIHIWREGSKRPSAGDTTLLRRP
jgi:dolichol-phosphate mannosyltransferase